jgi:hypothetical protein
MVKELLNQRYGDTIIQRPKPESESDFKKGGKNFPQNFSSVGFSVTKNTILLAYIVGMC